MAEITMNTLPANVAFTNTLTAEAVSDPGAKVRGVEYKDKTIRVQLLQLNHWIEVAMGDTVTIKVESSEEVAYYKNLGKVVEGLTVAVTAAE